MLVLDILALGYSALAYGITSPTVLEAGRNPQ